MPARDRNSRRRTTGVDEQLIGDERGPDATLRATATALARAGVARSVVLVEGVSDQIAVETAAVRFGRDLTAEGVVTVPIGGAQAIKHFLPRFAAAPGVRLSGLCDRSEAVYFARALARQGLLGLEDGNRGLERLGFHVCDADLEEELIRSVDEPDLLALLEAEDDLGAFRTLQRQPGWRDQPFEAQMHRWLRSVAGRRSRYARSLVLAADEGRVPPPLVALVDRM